jgi:hypothetical protein
MLTSFARQGVRAGPPEPPPPGVIDAGIQRFDGGSDVAWFRGTIPFAPGVITEASDLDSVVVLVNGSEPSSGLFIELIEGYHTDDSYRAARVEFQASVPSASLIPCTVNLSGVRTVADRTTAQDTVEFTTRAWQIAPTLFGITDAAYLCNSRIAPMPLIPDNHSGIPAPLLTYATSGMFADFLATTNAGGSQYDDPYAFYTRYLTSGDLAFLAEGAQRHASTGTGGEKPAVQGFGYYTAAPDFPYDRNTYPNATSTAPVNLNPVGYSTDNSGGHGLPAEPFDMTLSQLMTYWLTGWEYGRLHLEKGGCANATDYNFSLGTSARCNGNEIRNSLRRYLLPTITAYMLKPTREFDFDSGNTYKAPGQDWGAAAFNATFQERLTREMGRYQLYRDTVLAPPAWCPDLLGMSTDAANNTGGSGTPAFQLEFAWVFVLAYLNGSIPTQDMLDEAQKYVEFFLTQVTPLRTKTNFEEDSVRMTPYLIQDPAVVAAGTGISECTYTMMVAPMLAMLWALTGNTTARDLFDELIAKGRSQLYAFTSTGLAPGAVSAEILSIKLFGQMMHSIRHAIAWRVNGFIGWEAP